MPLLLMQGSLHYYLKTSDAWWLYIELINFCNMIRQIIVPINNTYTLELPDELLGRKVEVLAFEVESEAEVTTTDNKKQAVKFGKASDIFKDCRVDLTNYQFDRDAANTYE